MVFVAMSFDRRFDENWEEIILPAVREVEWQGQRLEAQRIDLSKKSDSIITEIVQCISQSLLVLADITTIGHLEGEGGGLRPIRNGNVLYEVGLAHAARLPEEVLLVRADNDRLDFDIAGVRVHAYEAENREASRVLIRDLIIDALGSVDLRKSLAIERGVQSLDVSMYLLLQESLQDVPHPHIKTFGDALASVERIAAINRLLSAEMFQATFKPLTAEMFNEPVANWITYRSTSYGRTVFAEARNRQKFGEALDAWLKTEEGQKWFKARRDSGEKTR